MPSTRHARFAFTSWLDHDPQEPVFDAKVHEYLVYGRETCPESKRIHHQGYVEFKRAYVDSTRFRPGVFLATLGLSKKAHIQKARASEFSNSKYCKKDGDFKTFGSPIQPGQRSDLKDVATAIVTGKKRSREVAFEFPEVYARNYRAFAQLEALSDEKKERPNMFVQWLWGGTGLGKTTYIRDKFPNSYLFKWHPSAIYFDGYSGEDTIIFDECSVAMFRFPYSLSFWNDLLSGKKASAQNARFGMKTIIATNYIFISNFTIHDCVKPLSTQVERDSFIRRFTCVTEARGKPKSSVEHVVFNSVDL